MTLTYDVLIIGAGAAGLAAARDLTNNGFKVLILEARDRIGGRIYSIRDPLRDDRIELGAEFIHGQPPETLSIVQAAGLKVVEVKGEYWSSEQGKLTQDFGDDDRESQIRRKMHEVQDDQSLQDFLATYFAGDEWREARDSISGFVQAYDAARPDRVSIQWMLKEEEAMAKIGADTNYRLIAPYDSVPRLLLDACKSENTDLHLNTIVKEVRWQSGSVEVHAESALGFSLQFSARCALITLPLGVLQAPADAPGAVRFTPTLPGKEAALRQLDMGLVVKVILRFRHRFWDQMDGLDDLSFLFTDDEFIRAWWTQTPITSPTLTGMSGNLQAARLSGRGERFIVEQAIASLARVFGLEKTQIEEWLDAWYVHDWGADPFARGVYSYVAAGGLDAVRQLAEPVSDTLFFAGEATDTEWRTGMVHGAIATGQRAAQEIKKALR